MFPEFLATTHFFPSFTFETLLANPLWPALLFYGPLSLSHGSPLPERVPAVRRKLNVGRRPQNKYLHRLKRQTLHAHLANPFWSSSCSQVIGYDNPNRRTSVQYVIYSTQRTWYNEVTWRGGRGMHSSGVSGIFVPFRAVKSLLNSQHIISHRGFW